jgi:hypothetical protein
MQTTKKYYGIYSPQFSDMASISVRRFSWAIEKSMPAAVDIMVKLLPSIISSTKVCQLCKDKEKCTACIFSKQFNPEEFSVLEAII